MRLYVNGTKYETARKRVSRTKQEVAWPRDWYRSRANSDPVLFTYILFSDTVRRKERDGKHATKGTERASHRAIS